MISCRFDAKSVASLQSSSNLVRRSQGAFIASTVRSVRNLASAEIRARQKRAAGLDEAYRARMRGKLGRRDAGQGQFVAMRVRNDKPGGTVNSVRKYSSEILRRCHIGADVREHRLI